MAALLDTNILVYALVALEGHITEQTAASFHLVKSASDLMVSSISWMELHVHIRQLQRARLEQLVKRLGGIQVVDVSRVIALRASELLSRRAREPEVCPVCLAVKGSSPCKRCKQSLSRTQRFADAIIVATADCVDVVDTLYTFDEGVIDMGALAPACDIRKPPLDGPALKDMDLHV